MPFEYHPDAYLVDSAEGEATHWGDIDDAIQVDETASTAGPVRLVPGKTHGRAVICQHTAPCPTCLLLALLIQGVKQQRVKLMEFSGSVDIGPALSTLEDSGGKRAGS